MWLRILTAIALLCAAAALTSATEPGPVATQAYDDVVRPFLETYCFSCHGPDKQKADRRYDTLGADFTDDRTLELWQDIVDQLNLGEMPPPKSKQPDAAMKQPVIAWITAELRMAHAATKSTGGRTVLRRLNRTEYDRTVRHLLALEPLLTDPTDSFPPDETVEHFENIGSALVTSDFLLQKYLDAANVFVERAVPGIATGPKPRAETYNFTAPFCPTGNRHDGQDVPGKYQNIRKNTSDEGGFLWLAKLREGVPHDGYYTLRFKAQAINRDYPYDERIVGVRKSEPLRVAVVAGSSAYGDLEHLTSSDRLLAEFDLPDDAPQWFETRIWLDAGYQPRLTFPNGPNRVKAIRGTLVQRYPQSFQGFISTYVPRSERMHPEHEQWLKEQEAAPAAAKAPAPKSRGRRLTTEGTSNNFNSTQGWATFFREYQGPRVRVFEVEITGPHFEQWPPPSYVALFGEHEPTLANAEAIVRRFAGRAFRRPATDDEVKVLVELVRRRQEGGEEPIEAIKVALKAVLCSPAFLYLNEPEGALDNYALASRLSYFLWSSMPDDALLEAAATGELHEPGALAAQARRMLADPRAAAFTENFTARWLQLYKVGSMPPSPTVHRDYYVDNLEPAMRRETQLFFRHLLEQNLPIDRFLDADFTFVNGGLARLYDIPGVSGSAFQKVTLTDRRRGGLLGQASVLTASANGIDTSPVIRGIWVLENMLGAPPAPPPPDVKPLEPDIRGATTIRDQLAKHRETAACAECHRRIDPLGFALENFDPIGGWRDRYPRPGGDAPGPSIDAAGQLPDGRTFNDISGLKEILLARRDQFARCLTEKMLAYSMGRTIEPADRPRIDDLVAALASRGYGLQDLVLLTVESEPFRTK